MGVSINSNGGFGLSIKAREYRGGEIKSSCVHRSRQQSFWGPACLDSLASAESESDEKVQKASRWVDVELHFLVGRKKQCGLAALHEVVAASRWSRAPSSDRGWADMRGTRQHGKCTD
jgi:hypothetical protein